MYKSLMLMYPVQVSLESNNYTQAIEDLTKAVDIKTKTAPSDSRYNGTVDQSFLSLYFKGIG